MPNENPILKKFGENVRQARLEYGIAQEALAMKAEIERSYMGTIERGTRNVTLVSICKIATALELEPSELLKGILPPKKND